MEETAEFW